MKRQGENRNFDAEPIGDLPTQCSIMRFCSVLNPSVDLELSV